MSILKILSLQKISVCDMIPSTYLLPPPKGCFVEDLMNKTAFNKPPLVLDGHLNLLMKRSLIIKGLNL